ncbi:GntR family transcriptional regulator [Verrucomicrobiales bacterium]|nr:GntR family transcriptional regulator [Verrucomicrobiales bacterium]
MAATQAEKSYSLLRDKIVEGDLAPGDRLVNRSLAEEFGVSVIPVREAINRMASEGLVNQIPGAGAFVRLPEEQEIRELWIFRECIECSSAAEAARHISDRELTELDTILDDWEALTAEIEKQSSGKATRAQMKQWMQNEKSFHNRIVEASRNRFLVRTAKENQMLTRLFGVESKPIRMKARDARRTHSEHGELIKALRRRDAETARRLMSEHIKGK